MTVETVETGYPGQSIWKALANPHRRRLLDALRGGPRTTGDLVGEIPELSRYAVMQHLEVLVEAGLVIVRRQGRQRFNHLNPVPLREWYERWVVPIGDAAASQLLALRAHVEDGRGGSEMSEPSMNVRVVQIETELRFRAGPDRVFSALTDEVMDWFPHSYGGDKTLAVVVEPRVGGRHFEDWGEGRGYLYGHVTEYDPPAALGFRGRIMAGVVLDTRYEMTADGTDTILTMSKTAVGPMTEEEAEGVLRFGDIARFEEPLRALVESAG